MDAAQQYVVWLCEDNTCYRVPNRRGENRETPFQILEETWHGGVSYLGANYVTFHFLSAAAINLLGRA